VNQNFIGTRAEDGDEDEQGNDDEGAVTVALLLKELRRLI
jgi:hypothetical protein